MEKCVYKWLHDYLNGQRQRFLNYFFHSSAIDIFGSFEKFKKTLILVLHFFRILSHCVLVHFPPVRLYTHTLFHVIAVEINVQEMMWFIYCDNNLSSILLKIKKRIFLNVQE